VGPAAFQPGQYAQLYRLIHQHAQLLVQVYLMAASSSDPGQRQVALKAHGMCEALQRFARQQASSRQAQVGLPAWLAAWLPGCLACGTVTLLGAWLLTALQRR
jgi:hypothetical protein